MTEPEENVIRFFMKHWTATLSNIPNPLTIVNYMIEYLYKKENEDKVLMVELSDFLEDVVLHDLVAK